MGRKGSKNRGKRKLEVTEEPVTARQPASASPAPKRPKSAGGARAPFFANRLDVPPVAPPRLLAPPSLKSLKEPLEMTVDEADSGAPTGEQLFSYLEDLQDEDSAVAGARTMAWLTYPLSISRFETECWERRCTLLHRGAAHYEPVCSVEDLHRLLADAPLQYGEHIDVTSYRALEGRKTLNAAGGLASESTAWRAFESEGWCLRFVRPHDHLRRLWQLMSQLEEYFGCGVALNAYLTPQPKKSGQTTQGFAPQYAEVDVFIMQVSGKQRFRLYAPTELLPRVSSGDLHPETIGKPFMDAVLAPGK